MPERTLQDRYRLLAASFRENDASATLREHLGPSFSQSLDAIVDGLWRDTACAPRDLDRERIASLLESVLPGRLGGDEPWAGDVPDVLEAFLGFVAREESLASAWEWTTAVAGARDAYEAALANPKRARMGDVKFTPDRRPAPKIGRNDPCVCGSGKKYKHCCLKLSQ